MPLRQPESMDECVYFTRRTNPTGTIVAWVFRAQCPACNKGLMGKPIDKKGKVLKKSPNYICKECKHEAEKEAYEDTLIVNIDYVCPHCGSHAECQVPFKRIKARILDEATGKKKNCDVIRFPCAACKTDVDIIKTKTAGR